MTAGKVIHHYAESLARGKFKPYLLSLNGSPLGLQFRACARFVPRRRIFAERGI